MCIRDSARSVEPEGYVLPAYASVEIAAQAADTAAATGTAAVSYTHLPAHETVLDLVCRLMLVTKTKNSACESSTLLCIGR